MADGKQMEVTNMYEYQGGEPLTEEAVYILQDGVARKTIIPDDTEVDKDAPND